MRDENVEMKALYRKGGACRHWGMKPPTRTTEAGRLALIPCKRGFGSSVERGGYGQQGCARLRSPPPPRHPSPGTLPKFNATDTHHENSDAGALFNLPLSRAFTTHW